MRFSSEIIRKDFKAQWHGRSSIRNRNSDGNLYVRYLYWNDGAWNRNYNWLDNDWNGNNPAALLATLSFLSRFGGRVLFCDLALPASEHLSDFFNRYRQGEIFLVIERFRLPHDHEEHFCRIELSYCKSDPRLLFLFGEIARDRYGLNDLYEQAIYFLAERMPVELRYGLIRAIPEDIDGFKASKHWQNRLGGGYSLRNGPNPI